MWRAERRLLFCEAKHFSNSELWAKKNKPKVINQLEKYNKQIVDKEKNILEAYKTSFDEYNRLMRRKYPDIPVICPQAGVEYIEIE